MLVAMRKSVRQISFRRCSVPSFSRTLMSGGIALVMLLGSQARAHDEPRRAKTIKAPLVTAYKACTSPNTYTAGPLPVPACSPPERSDDLCGFQGPFFKSGYGKASGITTPIGDFRLSFTAKGLNPG